MWAIIIEKRFLSILTHSLPQLQPACISYIFFAVLKHHAQGNS